MLRRLIDFARGPTAKRLGLVGSIAALAFFLRSLVAAFAEVDLGLLLSKHWLALLAAALLYALAYVPMTRAWILLAATAGAKAAPRALAAVFLTSQIAKYLPGNIAQFLGRAYAGHRIGVPLRVTGLALTLEIVGVLIASALLVGAAWSLGLDGGSAAIGLLSFAPMIGAAVAVAAAVALIGARNDAVQRSSRRLVNATLLHMLTLLLVAGGQLVIAISLLGHADLPVAGKIAAAILTGWLIGFVAPGAPAGLGLREMTFVSLLAGSFPSSALVLAAAAFRLITIGGDLVAWLVGLRLGAADGTRPSDLATLRAR